MEKVTLILKAQDISDLYERVLFVLKKAWSFENNPYTQELAMKISKQRSKKSFQGKDGAYYQKICLSEKEWKNILFLMDVNEIIKSRRVYRKNRREFVRVLNFRFPFDKYAKHDPSKQRIDRVKKRLSLNIKKALGYPRKLVTKCDSKILAYSLKRF